MEKSFLIPPFFLFEGVSLDIFQGLSELEKYIEPQDLIDGVYHAFDSSGNILNFHIAEKEQKQLWNNAQIEVVSFDSATISIKKDIFLKFLQNSYLAYFKNEPTNLNRQKLIEALIQKCGFS